VGGPPPDEWVSTDSERRERKVKREGKRKDRRRAGGEGERGEGERVRREYESPSSRLQNYMQTSVIVCILTDHNYTWLVHMNTVSTA